MCYEKKMVINILDIITIIILFPHSLELWTYLLLWQSYSFSIPDTSLTKYNN